MTALAASVNPWIRNNQSPNESEKVIANGAVLYYGALLATDGTNNQLAPCADSTVQKFEGIFFPKPISYSTFPVTGDGVKTGLCLHNLEVLLPCAGTVTNAKMGLAAYAADDGSVTDVNTLGPQCGTFIELGTVANTVWVFIKQPAMLLGV